VSEVHDQDPVSSPFTDVNESCHLAIDTQGQVIVADSYKHRVLLMNDKLQLLSQVKVKWYPRRLCYMHNKPASQLFVVHSSKRGQTESDTVSLFTIHSPLSTGC